MKLKLKKKNIIVLSVIGLLLFGGIAFGVTALLNKDEEKTKEKEYKQESDNKEDIQEDNEIHEDKEIVVPEVQIVDVNSKSRPYAVMINNIGAARPYHQGLQNAYLVYEIIVEGGITRYLALFKDKFPEAVGSVRSARHYYLDYALENDAYYVHWGWSPQAQSDISSLRINNLNGLTYGSPYFYRQKLKVSSEHTGYVNLKEMQNLVAKRNYRTETNKDLLLNYSATNIDMSKYEESGTAQKIDLKYSNGFTTNYVYDSSANVYKQSVNNKEHKDYGTGNQYTVKNIITYKVANKTIDSSGRQDLANVGSGEGYFITGGYVIPITWEKRSRSSETIYRYKNGEEITVNDGNTWIHIIPTNGNISIT